MTLSFSYNEAEARAREEEFNRTPAGRNHRRSQWAMLALMLVFSVVFFTYASAPGTSLLHIVFCITMGVFLPVSQWLSIQTGYFRGAMKSQWRVTAQEKGITVSTNDLPEQTVDWSYIARWEITDLFLILHYRDLSGKTRAENPFHIPRRAFASESEMYAFLALVDRYRGVATTQTAPVGAWYHSRTGVDTGAKNVNRINGSLGH